MYRYSSCNRIIECVNFSCNKIIKCVDFEQTHYVINKMLFHIIWFLTGLVCL